MPRFLSLLLTTVSFVGAQTAIRPLVNPFLYPGGTTNAASFLPPTLLGGALARGSVFTVTGDRLGPAEPEEATRLPFSASLAGVSLTLSRGPLSVPAWPVYVSANQINAILPSSLPAGTYSLRLQYNERLSNLIPVQVVDAAPGIFTQSGGGTGPALVAGLTVNANAQPLSSRALSATAPARQLRPGQVVSLWMTGLGPTTRGDNQAPLVADTPNEIEAWVGGRPVSARLYAGRAPAIPGVDQFVFLLPEDAPEGCYVPVQVRVNRQAVSNTATLAISRDRSACRDEFPLAVEQMQSEKLAVLLYRSTFQVLAGGERLNVTQDAAAARSLQRPPPGPVPFDPYLAPPPSGACASYHLAGNLLAEGLRPKLGLPADFGEILLENNGVRRALAPLAGQPGYLVSSLATEENELYFTEEPTNVRTAGAIDQIQPAPRLQRHNLNSFEQIDPARPLRLAWSAPPDTRTAIFGFAVDLPSNASAAFVCTAPADAESFVVPAYMLANFPTPRSQPTAQIVYLGVGVSSVPAERSHAVFGLTTAADFLWRQVQLRATPSIPSGAN